MFLTKECDYSVRIIRALSCGSKKTIEAIATEEKMPQKYAYKIIKKLVKAGLVHSTRGRIGGYTLIKPLGDFTLLDIIASVDTNRYINECLRGDSKCPFKNDPNKICTVHHELARVQSLIISELSSKTMDIVLQIIQP
ncbi:MAG: Rrf2 family transcriptional regulator [Defluviitaleaceae bacterium]|nr:Rrf2 family transcriptional regulator [Defluviitaleaceae bacterium]